METTYIGDLFTDDEIIACIQLYNDDPETFNAKCRERVIAPIAQRINEQSGRNHEPEELADAMETAILCLVLREMACNGENQHGTASRNT